LILTAIFWGGSPVRSRKVIRFGRWCGFWEPVGAVTALLRDEKRDLSDILMDLTDLSQFQ
jgi:hypothetical protein